MLPPRPMPEVDLDRHLLLVSWERAAAVRAVAMGGASMSGKKSVASNVVCLRWRCLREHSCWCIRACAVFEMCTHFRQACSRDVGSEIEVSRLTGRLASKAALSCKLRFKRSSLTTEASCYIYIARVRHLHSLRQKWNHFELVQ